MNTRATGCCNKVVQQGKGLSIPQKEKHQMVKRVCSHGNVTTEEREKEQNATARKHHLSGPEHERDMADKVKQGTWLHKNSF